LANFGSNSFLATFLRLYALDTIPPGLWPDEALNGVQALSEPLKIFYPENNGREGMIMWLDALSFRLWGVSMFSFRLVPALIGVLTVLVVYLLGVELFKKERGIIGGIFCGDFFFGILTFRELIFEQYYYHYFCALVFIFYF